MSRICDFESCGRKHLARGYCGGHYRQLRDKKELTRLGGQSIPFADRFWQKVDQSDNEGCWPWSGASIYLGYGQIWKSGGPKLAHRISYELVNGPIPEGMVIDHKCHRPTCVNPAHLQAVTPKQNSENLTGRRSNNKSGIRGVSWRADSARWVASVRSRTVVHRAGSFANLKDAEQAAIAKRNELFTNNLEDRKAAS